VYDIGFIFITRHSLLPFSDYTAFVPSDVHERMRRLCVHESVNEGGKEKNMQREKQDIQTEDVRESSVMKKQW